MTSGIKCFEDFGVGDVIALGETRVTAQDIVAFAAEFDPAPVHLGDTDAGAALRPVAAPDGSEALVRVDGPIASNWHVGSIFMRVLFDGLLAGAQAKGSPGIEAATWPTPVRPGDTLGFSLQVLETKTSRSRPDLGLVLFGFRGVNQRGEPVLVARSWTMFGRRTGGSHVV